MSEFDVEPEWDKSKGPKPKEEVTLVAPDPPEPPDDTDEELPPDPNFLVVRNAYGPGAHSVKLPDGTPMGVFLREQEMTSDDTRAFLTEMGMDSDLVDFFARNRGQGILADAEIAAHPAVQALAEAESLHADRMKVYRSAFLAAYKKTGKVK